MVWRQADVIPGFADDVVLLVPTCQELQYSMGHFAVKCKAYGMRISLSLSEAFVLIWKKVVYPLQFGEEFLHQMEESKYLGVMFILNLFVINNNGLPIIKDLVAMVITVISSILGSFTKSGQTLKTDHQELLCTCQYCT